jgi:hypothetical protein
MGLLDTYALTQVARVLGYGAQKYAPNEWRKGILWSRVFDATLRHLLSWNDGEDVDLETGLSHLAHAGCGVMFLLNYEQSHPELDDRYHKGGNDEEGDYNNREDFLSQDG